MKKIVAKAIRHNKPYILYILIVAVLVTILGVIAIVRSPNNGQSNGAGRQDVQTVANLAYPDSVLINESWLPEEHGRAIDTGDLSHVSHLSRNYQLAKPIPVSELISWYAAELERHGWLKCRTTIEASYQWCQSVHDREHYLSILYSRDAPELISEYSLGYSIGYLDSAGQTD